MSEIIFESDLQERNFRRCLALVQTRAKVCEDEGGKYLAVRPRNFVEFFTAMDNHGLERAEGLRRVCVRLQNDFSPRGWFQFRYG